jgi:hypothetical protein
VVAAFGGAWDNFRAHYQLPEDMDWGDALLGPQSHHFFTVGYLVLNINSSAREGRSDDDAIRFGLGKYHGGMGQMQSAQQTTGEETAFDPLRSALDDDFEGYIDDAMEFRQYRQP